MDTQKAYLLIEKCEQRLLDIFVEVRKIKNKRFKSGLDKIQIDILENKARLPVEKLRQIRELLYQYFETTDKECLDYLEYDYYESVIFFLVMESIKEGIKQD